MVGFRVKTMHPLGIGVTKNKYKNATIRVRITGCDTKHFLSLKGCKEVWH